MNIQNQICSEQETSIDNSFSSKRVESFKVSIYRFLLKHKEQLFKHLSAIFLQKIYDRSVEQEAKIKQEQSQVWIKRNIDNLFDSFKKIEIFQKESFNFRKEREQWIRTFEEMLVNNRQERRMYEESVKQLKLESQEQINYLKDQNKMLIETIKKGKLVQNTQKPVKNLFVDQKIQKWCKETHQQITQDIERLTKIFNDNLNKEKEKNELMQQQMIQKLKEFQQNEFKLIAQIQSLNQKNYHLCRQIQSNADLIEEITTQINCLQRLNKNNQKKSQYLLQQKLKAEQKYQSLRQHYNNLTQEKKSLKQKVEQFKLVIERLNYALQEIGTSKKKQISFSMELTDADEFSISNSNDKHLFEDKISEELQINASIIARYLLEFTDINAKQDKQMKAFDTLIQILKLNQSQLENINDWKKKYYHKVSKVGNGEYAKSIEMSIQNRFFQYLIEQD